MNLVGVELRTTAVHSQCMLLPHAVCIRIWTWTAACNCKGHEDFLVKAGLMIYEGSNS